MTGFLNFGGDAGAMVAQAPARVLGTPFMISAQRPALVVYTITATLNGGAGASSGEVQLRSDRANPPLTVVSQVHFSATAGSYAGGSVVMRGVLVALILPGHFVNLIITSGTNAALAIATIQEIVL